MRSCRALHRQRLRGPRGRVEVERAHLLIIMADGRKRRIALEGVQFEIRDAASASRFVRHLILHPVGDRVDLITPPDEGTIAPRVARMPEVPDNVVIIDIKDWEVVADWLRSGGRLGGRTVADLARLACVASPRFAVVIGEWAAEVAHEMTWERIGPMRASGDARHTLRPLEEAATRSARAADALVAALSRGAVCWW